MVNQLANDETDGKSRNCADHLAAEFAILASEARAAALRTCTGRLAHQMRNPLAALQAAGTSLREEMQDPDHQERLDLMLQEVTHMLDQISAEVRAVEKTEERAQEFDAAVEITNVVDMIRIANPEAPEINIQSQSEAICIAPRTAFRVAVYCLLEHLVTGPSAYSVSINLPWGNDRRQIHFAFMTEAREDRVALTSSAGDRVAPVDPLALQIAERFARDTNGHLKRWISKNGSQVITLDLLCVHD